MKLSRRARWAVPAAGIAATGAVIAGMTIPTASAAPALPAKTPAQLLALVGSQHKVPPLTGTVVETTSLGLPQLPQTGNSTSLSSLLTGSHTMKVYWQDPRHFRLAAVQNMSETDLIANGNTAWLWESTRNQVTKFSAPAGGRHTRLGDNSNKTPAAPDITKTPLTPQQAANEVLQAVGKTTVVTTRSNVTVAGEAAYQLVLAPRDHRSTIGSVVLAVDGKTGVPLSVQVFGKGSSTPAFQVGFTDISYTAPAAANFDFTPPKGATVTTPGAARTKDKPAAGQLPAGKTGTYGSGWISVAMLPESVLRPGASEGTGAKAQPSPSGSSGSVLGGDSQEIVNAIFGAAKPVSGAWGSGQLLHTSLLNVLITGGQIYVGAVDPSVLEAAVGHTTPTGRSH